MSRQKRRELDQSRLKRFTFDERRLVEIFPSTLNFLSSIVVDFRLISLVTSIVS